MFTVEEARKLLNAAGVFIGVWSPSDDPKCEQTLNLNDALAYACSDAEYVSDEELQRVAELFWRWGWCGILYWVTQEKQKGSGTQFKDARRWIEFVKHEQALVDHFPSSTERSQVKRVYTLGD